ncbi:unnamed protein product [Caenorhabditis sp. 36 PRJEB53466]|nr:unnamed protein product [Caenorhabditis sp. 36 PRJEB53466]
MHNFCATTTPSRPILKPLRPSDLVRKFTDNLTSGTNAVYALKRLFELPCQLEVFERFGTEEAARKYINVHPMAVIDVLDKLASLREQRTAKLGVEEGRLELDGIGFAKNEIEERKKAQEGRDQNENDRIFLSAFQTMRLSQVKASVKVDYSKFKITKRTK